MSEATTMGLTAHSGHHRLLVIVAGGVAAFEGYDLASDGVTIPSVLGSDLEVTPQLAGYVGSLPATGMLVGAGLCALVIGSIGGRRLLFTGSGLFSVGMPACAVVRDFDLLAVSRAAVGTGMGIVPATLVVRRRSDEVRGPAIGWALSIGRLGATVGPTMGSPILSSSLEVQWNFYLFAVPGAVGAVLAACVPTITSRRSAVSPSAAEAVAVRTA
jgi:MFS family permease